MSNAPNPGDITVVGQRRTSPTAAFPTRSTAGGMPPDEMEPGVEKPIVEDGGDPCSVPELALEWNADAVTAAAVQEFISRAASRTPSETLNTREWGAALFQMPDGSVVLGNIRSGAETFQNPGPDGRASVDIDWTPPPGGLPLGAVHTHNAGGHLPSGSSPTSDDQDSLRYIREVRSQAGANPNQARIYIAALTLSPANVSQYAKINV